MCQQSVFHILPFILTAKPKKCFVQRFKLIINGVKKGKRGRREGKTEEKEEKGEKKERKKGGKKERKREGKKGGKDKGGNPVDRRGSYIPECAPNGKYAKMQCSGGMKK